MKVKLHTIERAGPKQTAFAEKAVSLLEKALNNPNFESGFMAKSFRDLLFYDGSRNWVTLTKKQAYEKLMSGSELGAAGDGRIDLRVRLDDFENDRVLGEWNGGLTFRTNYHWIDRWLDRDQPERLAGHFAHEWSHVCGFRHKGRRVRPDVPYHFGNTVIEMLSGSNSDRSGIDFFHDHAICGQRAGSIISVEELEELMQ